MTHTYALLRCLTLATLLTLLGSAETALLPDLRPYVSDPGFFSPPTVAPGDAFFVRASVHNAANGPADAFTVAFYLSSDPVITSADVELGRAVCAGADSQQLVYVMGYSMTIPADTTPGTKYIGYIIDPDNLVAESNEASNVCLFVSSLQVMDVPGLPDINSSYASGGHTIIPAAATVVGGGMSITAATRVSNRSIGPITTRFYASVDNIITAADIEIGSRRLSYNTGAGGTTMIAWSGTLPPTVTAGSWYFGAISDSDGEVAESNESNNFLIFPNPVVVSNAATTIDLTTLSVTRSGTFVHGASVTLSATCRNDGNRNCPGLSAAFYASHDGVLDAGDLLLATIIFDTGPAAGRSVYPYAVITVPASMTGGGWQLLCKADAADAIAETNETNNVGSYVGPITVTDPVGIDLLGSGGTVPDPPVVQGGSLSGTADIWNAGMVNSGSFNVRFYASTNSRITTGDVDLGAVTISELTAGSTSTATFSCTLPVGLAPGSYVVGCLIDPLGSVTETLETNNTFALPGLLQVIAAPASYTVTYDAHGGLGTIADDTKIEGTPLTLSDGSGFTWTGHTCTAWNTAADGSGSGYALSGTYSTDAAVTLYAQWTLNTYTIGYDANGGSGSIAAGTKTYGVDLPLSNGSGLSRTGYAFADWNTAANGSGTAYAAGATYSANAALTLYAQWTLNTYALNYDANGATSGMVPAPQTKTYDIDLILATNSGSLAKAGSTFAGWNTAANGSGTGYAIGATYTANTATTLYAVWQTSGGGSGGSGGGGGCGAGAVGGLLLAFLGFGLHRRRAD